MLILVLTALSCLSDDGICFLSITSTAQNLLTAGPLSLDTAVVFTAV